MDDVDLERLEIEDQAETVGYLTPREYAKLRDMQPQLVYYYIRTKVIEVELCKCGRKVISVRAADEALQKKKTTRGGDLAGVLGARDRAVEEGQRSPVQGVPQVDSVEGSVGEVRAPGDTDQPDVDLSVRQRPEVG